MEQTENIYTPEELRRMKLYNRAINIYGIVNQEWMLVEETGELLEAAAKLRRLRVTKEDVITELADVHIMVEQMAFFYGLDEFKAEKERKLERLEERLKNVGK